jgi:uncharacterized protein DUF3105
MRYSADRGRRIRDASRPHPGVRSLAGQARKSRSGSATLGRAVASRKEERERRRQQRIEAERQAAAANRRKLMAGYVVAGLLGAAVIIGIVVALTSGGGDGKSGKPAKIPSEVLQKARLAHCKATSHKNQGRQHLLPGEKPPKYSTNPPTSGAHDPIPAADGIFKKAPPTEKSVHSLEHGRINIQYDPALPPDAKRALRKLVEDDKLGPQSRHILLFPNEDMPYEVAATAWTQLLGCEKYSGKRTIAAIAAFRDAFRDKGPERVP